MRLLLLAFGLVPALALPSLHHDHAHEPGQVQNATDKASSSMTANKSDPPPDPGMHSHSHGSHAAPKEVLDDADLHYWHHYPPSYLAADFRLDKNSAIFGEEFDETWHPELANGHRGLLVIHVVSFCLAYFGALPIALALRAANHSAHFIVNGVFLGLTVMGWNTGAAYSSATPDRYEGSTHGSLGSSLVFLSIGLALFDSLGLIARLPAFWHQPHKALSVLREIVKGNSTDHYEMLRLVESEEYESGRDLRARRPASEVVFIIGGDEDDEAYRQSATNDRASPLTRQYSPHGLSSHGSEHTLHDTPLESFASGKQSMLQEDRRNAKDTQGSLTPLRLLTICLTWVRRAQVVLAYVVVLTGLTIYTGMCRGNFINSCAAHFIKGSIFFGYGTLTFARYLGAYADLGWAWNKQSPTAPSAEMIECWVIFVYGITNTWMERFGAAPEDPYSVKQVQHISIAVMFWFAGLSGILLESKTVRRILAVSSAGDAREPTSYSFSFNPLPALTIAVTGLAMAAHHQDYLFQVKIHSLWGVLLAGGSFFRLLTYFFLFIRPPVDSVLPSRPPTEVLAAFGWAAGGIVFILSDEEIAFAAMRAGYDDVMAFLNITIALTCLVFCWEVVIMTIKGAAVIRVKRDTQDVN